MAGRPKINSESQNELDKIEKQSDEFNQNIQTMTLDRMNAAPLTEQEPQTKIAQKDLDKIKDIYLKPKRTIGSKEKFDEKWRDKYNFEKEYVCFIAENKEIIGESIEMWTKPFPGMPAEFWEVPTNKRIYGPRYLAEQIHSRKYHRFVMQRNVSAGGDHMGEYYGSMAVDTTINRLDAQPTTTKKSIFMGESSFK